MTRIALVSLAALIATASLAAHAAETVNVPAFNSVGLEGGGHVSLRHGDHQTVTLVNGSTQHTRFTVENGNLKIDACDNDCPEHYNLQIEIVTPDIEGVAISGGGKIESQGDFPSRHAISAAVAGGGTIDLRSIAAKESDTAVNGGGKIDVTVSDRLSAAVNGGGKVTYWGHPHVSSVINGGGSVASSDGRVTSSGNGG